ncbi:MAG TPA: hypothetical protein DDY38_08920, partial [Firmicutes bacterium]|nr:hypothetical protein [Bacillota bacterium]
ISGCLQLLEDALAQQDLSLALALTNRAGSMEIEDDITVRSMRELEDRPYNPAALFLAGIYSCRSP